MYIRKDGFSYYNQHDEQCRSRGAFLILLSRDNVDGFRAIVRSVALRQCGHWMMGIARVFGESLSLSGSYGGDGLPVWLDSPYKKQSAEWKARVWSSAIPLPQELYDQWANGGGHNSAGSEAPAMRAWARETF